MKFSKTALIFLLGAASITAPQAASAQSFAVGVSINVAPPALPVYVQPPCPTEGYLWTPGYWGYANAGYFWVPGVWVAPPRPNLLWTPGYWGFSTGIYAWNPGYWGAHVGYYGGINYGFGYGGVGFFGGHWAGGAFAYNTAYANVNTTIVHNTYVRNTYVNSTTVNDSHASFNGPGGVTAQPGPREQRFANQEHVDATQGQLDHQQAMSADRGQFASYNHGSPQTPAMDSVNGRRFDQQGRIANGVGSGELTPSETRNLESRESNLNGEVKDDRSANGGALTPQEHQQIEGQQNALGRSIYDDKHNGAADQYGNNEVGDRRDEQQQRISNGIRSGEMTPREAANTEQRESNINSSVRADRAANGGRLTSGERAGINRRQNKVSAQIYRQKHNTSHAPK